MHSRRTWYNDCLQVAAINAAMSSLVKTLNVFPKERTIVQRERAKVSTLAALPERHHDTVKQTCVVEQALLWCGCATEDLCCEGVMIMKQAHSACLCVCAPKHQAHMAHRTSPCMPVGAHRAHAR